MFGQKQKFLGKNQNFGKIEIFGQKSKFWSKIKIFGRKSKFFIENPYCWSKNPILNKNT